MTESQLADTQLMEAIKSGDEAAFLLLYRGLQAPIYRFALQMSGSRSVAEDVIQEVFLTVIHRSAGFDASKGAIAAYVMGIARKCLHRRLQAERGFISFGSTQEESEAAAGPAAAESNPLADIARNETAQMIRQAVISLPIHYREVVVLCGLEEKSYQDAAEILGCAAGTVRSRLHRARELLLQKLRTSELQTELAPASSRRCPA